MGKSKSARTLLTTYVHPAKLPRKWSAIRSLPEKEKRAQMETTGHTDAGMPRRKCGYRKDVVEHVDTYPGGHTEDYRGGNIAAHLVFYKIHSCKLKIRA